MTRIVARALAKLNLGLEVLGRRSDGYHDIATIFQTIDLCDVITIEPNSHLKVAIDASLASEANLAEAAAIALRDHRQIDQGATVQIEKQIPIAAGLGGASSDAATTLRALASFWNIESDGEVLFELALKLGCDVPFFLVGGTAIGHGRGEQLERIDGTLDAWIILASPQIAIPNKTRSMFSKLVATDCSSGETISTIARRIESTQAVDPQSLPNAFARPLYEAFPHLQDLAGAFRAAGAAGVAITGAGPSHYTLTNQEGEARAIAERLHRSLGASASVFVCRPIACVPALVRENG